MGIYYTSSNSSQLDLPRPNPLVHYVPAEFLYTDIVQIPYFAKYQHRLGFTHAQNWISPCDDI